MELDFIIIFAITLLVFLAIRPYLHKVLEMGGLAILSLSPEKRKVWEMEQSWNDFKNKMNEASALNLSDDELIAFCHKNQDQLQEVYILGHSYFDAVEDKLKKAWFKGFESQVYNNIAYCTNLKRESIIKEYSINNNLSCLEDDTQTIAFLKQSFA